jgi:tetratricopeptide (TPR) repeat protein
MTILIAARNDGSTIARAIRSASQESSCPIILVDDHCTDQTVAVARRVGGDRLQVVPARAPGGVAIARQCGLDAVGTEFAAWLDADDEWIPGRAARLGAALAHGCDVATEPIELHDGTSGARLRRLDIPEFVRREKTPARLFERNYLPGDSQLAFRVGLFRAAGGYDPEIFGAESFDLLLRAIRAGARFSYGDEAGYRMFAYAGSVSRNLPRQRASLAAALRKHDYEAVRSLCLAAGESPRVAAWVLTAMALYREEADAALHFLDEACPAGANPDEILEADGPLNVPEGWRRDFTAGTCYLLLGSPREAETILARAEQQLQTAEGANNRGVALAQLYRWSDAEDCFRIALERFPGFADARANLDNHASPARVTTHPLRRQPSRAEYQAT